MTAAPNPDPATLPFRAWLITDNKAGGGWSITPIVDGAKIPLGPFQTPGALVEALLMETRR